MTDLHKALAKLTEEMREAEAELAAQHKLAEGEVPLYKEARALRRSADHSPELIERYRIIQAATEDAFPALKEARLKLRGIVKRRNKVRGKIRRLARRNDGETAATP